MLSDGCMCCGVHVMPVDVLMMCKRLCCVDLLMCWRVDVLMCYRVVTVLMCWRVDNIVLMITLVFWRVVCRVDVSC